MSPKPDDLDFEIEFYEKLLKRKPDFVDALAALGDLYTQKGLNTEAVKVDEKLAQLKPYDSKALYNLACSYSLLNEVDNALEAIQKAIARGYRNFEHMEKDQDLSNLRLDDRFQRYYLKIQQKRMKGTCPDLPN